MKTKFTMKIGMVLLAATCAVACGASAQTSLPDGWIDVPFGAYTTAWEGGASYDSGSGTFTLVGSGNDMWGSANDGGRFVFQPMLGDCEVVANVRRLTAPNLAYGARAGVLIRQRNDRGSQSMLFARMRGESGNLNVGRVTSAARLVPLNTPEVLHQNGFEDEWIQMRLIRQGDVARAFFNTNGTWELFQTYSVPMGEAVNAGIFVTRYSDSAAQQITNEFKQVAARQLVTVQTNALAGLDIAWVTNLPGIVAGWEYTYTLTRTAEGGTPEPLGQGIALAAFTDAAPVPGTVYRYTVTAVPVPQEDVAAPPDVPIGTSGATRLQVTDVNPVSGLPQGLLAAYHAPIDALPFVTRVDNSVTNVVANYPGGVANNFRTLFNARLMVDTTDTYTFFADSDDAFRLWVNGVLVFDNYYGGRNKASSMPVRLEAGRVAAFRAEYRQDTGERACTLTWRRTGDPAIVPVPTEVFSPVPLPWLNTDIGGTTLNGNALFDTGLGTITVTADGNDLTGAVDACHFVWRDADGDFDIAARLDSLTGAGGQRAGLAARMGMEPGACALTLLAAPSAGAYTVTALSRDAAGTAPTAADVATGVAVGAPLWLRLTRSGMTLSAWFRADTAAEWTLAETYALPLGTWTLRVGTVASSAQAVFTMEDATLLSETLSPTHDTYVQADNGTKGTAGELLLKRVLGDFTDVTHREGFMRFNVAGRSDVRTAMLRLYLYARDANPAEQGLLLRAFNDLHWSETAATWTNAPGGLRMPTVFLADDDPTIVCKTPLPMNGFIEIDVTDAVRKSARGTGDLTFNLAGTVPVTGGAINFCSKENGTAALRPALILRYGAPVNVAAASGLDVGSVTVTWQAIPDARSNLIYRAAAPGSSFAPVGSTAQAIFTDTGLTPGQTYFYQVSALTADGETARSEIVQGTASAAGGTVMYVSADTYVNGGQSANNNYGLVDELVLKNNTSDQNYHRESYLLFNDIAELGHAERVVLRVTPKTASGDSVDPSKIPVQFIRMPSNNWSESTVTFNNPPPGYPPPTPILNNQPLKDRVTVPAGQVSTAMEVDVTEMVREAARVNADGKLSIGVLRTDSIGGFNFVLHSKDQANNSWKPQLVYTLGRLRPPAVADSGSCMTVSWPPYRGATSYVVRRAESPEGPYAVVGTTTDRVFRDMAAEAGTVYWYTLTAITASGETEASLPVAGCIDATEERAPVADTMIENVNSTTANANYGTAALVNLKRDPVREAFFKFDVRGLENVSRARFRVNVNAQDGAYSPVNAIVRYGDFGDWNETGVTYNEPPRGYTPPSTSTAAKGSNEVVRILMAYRDANLRLANWLEADVTEVVRQAARDGQRFITLFLTGDDTLKHEKGIANVATREHARPECRPVLLLGGKCFGTPQGLTLEAQADWPGFTLAWRPVAGAVRYIITRQGADDAAPVTLSDSVTGTTFADSDSTLWNERDYTYTVTAVHADGTLSDAATLTRTLTRTFARTVVADTFVRGGIYSNGVNGLSQVLEVKGDANIDYQREAAFRIAVDNAQPFVNAEFRFRLRTLNPGRDYRVVLREMPDTGWAESGAPAATWHGVLGENAPRTPAPQPGDPTEVGRFIVTDAIQPGDDMSFDVTRFLKAAQARGASSIMLHLFIVDLGGENILSVYSRQAAMFDDMPHVVYTVPRSFDPGTIMILR